MYPLLVIAFVVAGCAGQHDLAAEETVPPIQVYGLDEMHTHDEKHHKHEPHNIYLKEIHNNLGRSKVEKIATDFFNPDYIEPITVLDYRYLKTGGRDYTRGPGGQILILPKGVRIHEKKEFENYDEMLEYLRHKQKAELEAHHKKMHSLGHTEYHKHHIEITGDHVSKRDAKKSKNALNGNVEKIST